MVAPAAQAKACGYVLHTNPVAAAFQAARAIALIPNPSEDGASRVPYRLRAPKALFWTSQNEISISAFYQEAVLQFLRATLTLSLLKVRAGYYNVKTRREIMNKIEIIAKLKERIESLKSLSARSVQDSSYIKWRRDTKVALENLFGKDSDQVREFCSIRFVPGLKSSNSTTDREAAFARGKDSAEATFQSMIEEVEEYWHEKEDVAPGFEETTPPKSKKIFIVHGHDEAAKESVARFIKKLDLEPVILHEQPNQNRTIIEKFEKYSDVSFAVVLMTADDKGGKKEEYSKDYKYRARQNVILELGFFLAHLGREHVCVLYEEGVELPSDYDGVLWAALDKFGAWKLELVRELRASGIEVDANKIT